MSGSPADGELDPRVQAGIDHLQRAAREVIAASRALLDVAEELVDDPRTAAGVVDLVRGMAGSAGAPARRAPSSGEGGADDDDGPAVQRIPVS